MPPSEQACCVVCHVPAKQVCSACKMVNYCGSDHQRQHWGQHKNECQPYKVAKDSVFGRYLLATRDIRGDMLIFREMPLIVGPKWYLTEKDEQMPVMPCVGCFTPCRIGMNHCPRCKWPACSPICGGLENPNLHGIECTVLMLGPGPAGHDIHSQIDYFRTDALMVLKCLLLQRRNPKKWADFLDMQSHEEERVGSELHADAERRIVSFLQKNFLQRLKSADKNTKEKFLQEYDATVLHRICGIIETNYMCINLPTGLELSGVFYRACMMEHDCKPNCYFQFDHSNGFRISVIAGRDIKKGEHLKITYTNMLWGTQMRQEHLGITKHFVCRCERCTDPTEFGTYFSAMLCIGDVNKVCGGVQLPKDPLNMKSDWVCEKCPMVITGEEVRYLLTQMTEEVESVLARKSTIKELEILIAKFAKFLHPNHYHMFSLKHSLIQLIGKEPGYVIGQLSEVQLQRKMNLCVQLYDVCYRLDPSTIRLSLYVGIILYEMQTVLMERGKRLLAQNKPHEAVQQFKEADDYMLRAAKVLKKELDNVAGAKLSDTVLKTMADLQTLIKNNE